MKWSLPISLAAVLVAGGCEGPPPAPPWKQSLVEGTFVPLGDSRFGERPTRFRTPDAPEIRNGPGDPSAAAPAAPPRTMPPVRPAAAPQPPERNAPRMLPPVSPPQILRDD